MVELYSGSELGRLEFRESCLEVEAAPSRGSNTVHAGGDLGGSSILEAVNW